MIFTAGGYLYLQQQAFAKTCHGIADFHTTTVQELEASVALQLDDKLYLMGEVRIEELETHSQLHRTITERGLRINDWRDQLDGMGFRLLRKLEAWDYFNWVFPRDTPIHHQWTSAHQHLNNTGSALALTDDLNSALFHLKRRFYPLAKRNVDKALDKLAVTADPAKPFPFMGLTAGYVMGHAYNIAAKVARAQGDYEQSDACYKSALDHLPHHPKLVGSQIALWGDWAWRSKDPDPSKLRRFMEESYYKAMAQDLEGYGLGLANLSWVMLQAYENAHQLALTDQEQQ